jgi:hypothetical protein
VRRLDIIYLIRSQDEIQLIEKYGPIYDCFVLIMLVPINPTNEFSNPHCKFVAFDLMKEQITL